jgi:hypothetical protein
MSNIIHDWRKPYDAATLISFREVSEWGEARIVATHKNLSIFSPTLTVSESIIRYTESPDSEASVDVIMPTIQNCEDEYQMNFRKLIEDIDNLLREHIVLFPDAIRHFAIDSQQAGRLMQRQFNRFYDDQTNQDIMRCKAKLFRDIPVCDFHGRRIPNVRELRKGQKCRVHLVYNGPSNKIWGPFRNNWTISCLYLDK